MKDGGQAPAHPTEVRESYCDRPGEQHFSGLTKREYAAIHLRVPESGSPWLDAMIRKSQLDDMASKSMQELVGKILAWSADKGANVSPSAAIEAIQTASEMSYTVAEAMIRQAHPKEQP